MRRGTPAQVGFFVVLGVGLMVGFFLFLKGSPLAVRQEYRIHVLFDDVQGLVPGTPVHLAGVEIGTVESVDLTPTNRADVVLRLKRRYRLYRGYRFLLRSGALLGDKRLVVEAKDEKGQPIRGGQVLKEGDVVEGVPPISWEEIFPEAKALAQELRSTVHAFRSALAEPETLEAVRQTVKNLAAATEEVARLGEQVNQVFGQSQGDLRRLMMSLSRASEDVAALTRANRRPLEQMLRSSAGAAQALERVVRANEKELARVVRNLAALTEESHRLLQQNQASVQTLLANAAEASAHLRELLASTQKEWPALLEDLQQGVQSWNRMMAEAQGDWKALAQHWREASATLETSLERAQPRLERILADWEGASQEIRRLSEATRQMWVEEGGAKELQESLTALRRTLQELQAIVEDTEFQQGLKGTLTASRRTLEETSLFVARAHRALERGIFGTLGTVRGQPEFDFQWLPERERYRTDLNLRWLWPSGGLVLLGLEDVGEQERWNLQVGRKVNPRNALRLGLYRSTLGVGWDSWPTRRWNFSLELYDPNRGSLLWESRYWLAPRWWLLGGVEEPFHRPDLYLGVRFGGE